LDILTDAELVSLSQQGNVSAFNQLAGRWETPLYGFVRRTLGDAEEARDVCQDALVKAFANIARLRDGAKFKSWLHYIALNLCRDRFRTVKSRATILSYDDVGGENLVAEATGTEGADRLSEATDLTEKLGSLLAAIPTEQRTSILLREYQGFTSEEIGEMMGVPAATVRTRIYYGLKAMRKLMNERGLTRMDFQ
jgi:RNA polymerase sigma-70 factor (ECF subfamily)